MDGRGSWRDNVFVERLWRSVKYEEVYLKAYDTVAEARLSSISYGKEKPKVQGHDDESWLINRNCQFSLQ